MKKIMMLICLILLTGCGKKISCSHQFSNEMTKSYKTDAMECETVTYTAMDKKLEIVTTPNEEGNTFVAAIKYGNYELTHSYRRNQFKNGKIYSHNNVNFLELYDVRDYVTLILFDMDGNIRFETNNISRPIIKDNKFIINEYLLYLNSLNDEYICEYYSNMDSIIYIEKTYSIGTMELVSEKEVALKDVCK